MRSNYKKIGDYIQLVDERNKDLKVDTLLGLTVDKKFIPSVANTVGTNMANYKIIRKDQFACSLMQVRRDKKIPVALLRAFDEAIISQAYPVFEIADSGKLLPEYLMMWMSRSEFDREACFYAVGGVRGSLEWEDFCNMELPVPSPEKQREIVKEYHIIVNRINLNDQLNQKLEETAQAIYKKWFIDFEFPISAKYAAAIGKPELEGKPYKSSSGEMVYNYELDQEIPEGWGIGSLDYFADLIDGDRGSNYPGQEEFSVDGYCLFLNTGNVTKDGFNFSSNSFITKEKDNLLRKGKLERNDIVLTTRGTVGNSAYYSQVVEYDNIRINSGMIILRAKNKGNDPLFVYLLLRSYPMKKTIENYLSGSAQQHLPLRDIKEIFVATPVKNLIPLAMTYAQALQKHLDLSSKQNRGLFKLKNIILAKMTKAGGQSEIH